MMEVRTYRGKEMGVVLAQIKEELGEEVEILTTRQRGPDEFEVRVSIGQMGAPIERVTEPASNSIEDLPRFGRPPGIILEQVEELLLKQGVHPSLIKEMLIQCTSSSVTIDAAMAEAIEGVLTFDATLPKQRVVAVVGAAGVGKTTTIAKIAANMKLAFNMSIGLVASDLTRVGGCEQLEQFADALSLNCVRVDSELPLAEGIYKAVKSLGRCDLVLVDTVGCSPRENERLRVLGHALTQLRWCEKILLLPALGNDVDLRAMARAFVPLDCSRVIVSKTDESTYMGPILNTLSSLGKEIAFFSTGQNLPEDIEPASAARFAWMLARQFH